MIKIVLAAVLGIVDFKQFPEKVVVAALAVALMLPRVCNYNII